MKKACKKYILEMGEYVLKTLKQNKEVQDA